MTEASAAVNGNNNGGADASPARTMAASRKPPLRKRRRFRVSIVPYLFVAPFLLLFAAFLVAPLVYALYTSVFRDTLVGGRQFVGFANYLRVAVDSNFWGGVSNLLFFGATQVPIMLGLALTLGIVLDRGALHARGLFRLGFFIPYAVPSVVAALVWGYIYGPAFGPFSQLARGLGLPPPDFLSNRTMLFSLANIVTWEFTGYNMIIYYAALKAIPPDLREAAVMDGAGAYYCVGARTGFGVRARPAGARAERFDQSRVGLHHICFRAKEHDEVDEAHAFLSAIGATIVHPPQEDDWAPGYYSVLFEDPDGVRLEINHVPGRGLLAEGGPNTVGQSLNP